MVRGGRVGVLVGVLASTAVARGDVLEEARDHFRRATKAYEVAQYDEAIQEFAAAYKLKDDTSILFNLAQAHRLAGHRAEALRVYRMFLLKVPSAPNRREVEAMIANLQQDRDPHAEDPDRELARRYADAGAAKFAAQQFAEALVEFEKARLVRPRPGLDLNIARTYDRLGRLEEALASYRLYVEAKPEPTDAAEMRARIQVLEERLAASRPTAPAAEPAAPVAAPAIAPPPVDPRSDRGRSDRTRTLAGLVVGAVGVGMLASGLACGVLAQQNGSDLTALDENKGTFVPAKQSAGQSEQIAAGVLLGVGAVAVVTGVVLVVMGRRRTRSTVVVPSAGPSVGWSF